MSAEQKEAGGDRITVVRIQYETPPAADAPASACTRGTFLLELHRAWATTSYDRFLCLLDAGFLHDQHLCRAVPGFVLDWNYGPTAGTGARDGDACAKLYAELEWFKPQEVEPAQGCRQRRNCAGTISFGQEEDGTTKTEVFINMGDNSQVLDKLGFWPFGKVIPSVPSLEAGQTDREETSDEVRGLLSAWQGAAAPEKGDVRSRKARAEGTAPADAPAMNFSHGDIFFAGGATAKKAHIR